MVFALEFHRSTPEPPPARQSCRNFLTAARPTTAPPPAGGETRKSGDNDGQGQQPYGGANRTAPPAETQAAWPPPSPVSRPALPCHAPEIGRKIHSKPMSLQHPFLPPDPAIERRVHELGETLFARMDSAPVPGIFSKKGAYARVMEWSMKDPAFKTQLFRFVDVLPALSSSADIVLHLQE